ncbi:MAG TPA: 50S ribosomal protein L1 [Candidatus Saccharimonadales bacterium]|nr:50S ribosomal protein L1 [Candidatus Saccharimonadales bacterium]
MAAAKKNEVPAEVAEEIVEAQTTEVVEAKAEKATTKAGKRSAKGLEEAEAKAEKVEKQQHRAEEKAEEAEKPKQPVKPTRTRLERRSKSYRKVAEQIEKGKVYSLKDALELATKTSSVKFDASVELHVNLGVDPRQADQNIRANLVLPQGTGKTVRVAVFADDKVDGADLSGVEAITKELEKGTISFDILVSTPANMAKLGKYARLLGPRGLMPNPKSGTVTTDISKAVAEAKAGRVEYRVDSTGIVHLAVGKVSFGGDRLLQNASAVIASIRAAKPASVKGNYVKAIHVTTTMGPSITVAANE